MPLHALTAHSSMLHKKIASELVNLTLKKDGFGVRAEISEDGICYDADWNHAQNMCFLKRAFPTHYRGYICH